MRGPNHAAVIDALRQTFRQRKTVPATWRRQQLQQLAAMLRENEAVFADALYSDLKKSVFESYFSETGFVLSEIRYALKHLSAWMKPSRLEQSAANDCFELSNNQRKVAPGPADSNII